MPDTQSETQSTLRLIADAEGGEMWMGWPDRWWDDAHWRCEHDHVSTSVLRSEALGRDACLACRSPVMLTFPEDRDGPLEPEAWRCAGCGATTGRYDDGEACERCVLASFAEGG